MTTWNIEPAPKTGELGAAIFALLEPGATFELIGSDLKDLRVFNGTAPDQAALEAKITEQRGLPPVKEPTLEDVFKGLLSKAKGEPDADQKLAELEAKFEATKPKSAEDAVVTP